MRNFDELLKAARERKPVRVAVAAAGDLDVLEAVNKASQLGIATGIFVGDRDFIEKTAASAGIDLSTHRVEHASDAGEAARKSVALVRAGEADILMKGNIQTADLLRAVLDREQGLRTGKILSHVALVEVPGYHKLLMVSDGGLNIAPDLKTKFEITQNAINVAHTLGWAEPKVALLSALELVNPDMPSTIDAALIAKAAERGQIRGALVDGPLAADGALSKEAAEHKKIVSPVAGVADVLIVPNIETGNILLKGLQYLAGATWAGVVVGARAPVLVLSRADHAKAKMFAIALGQLLV
jgi:phosphate butyryltransferase